MSKDKSGWNKYRRGPVNRDKTISAVRIDSLSSNGDGVGRLDGQVVFVPFTLPGEKISLKQVSKKRKLIHAQIEEILEPSDQRQQPPCAVFGDCGGCDWQHLPYDLQLTAKTQQLQDALQRIGKFENPPIEPIVASPSAFHYRNRIRGHVESGQFHFNQRASAQKVAIDQCHIADEAINTYLSEGNLEGVKGKVELAVDDEGLVRVMAVDEQQSTDAGFRQVNTAVSNLLSEKINSAAEHFTGETLIDLYCGQGTWSIELAQRFTQCQLLGVDSSKQNIHIANQKVQQAKLSNVRFEQGRVEERLRSMPLADSFCIVDPPRAGLAPELCQALCGNNPTTLVYISCHAASLARDLQLLCDSGMRLQSVTPLDMFPQTAHLETLSILKRK